MIETLTKDISEDSTSILQGLERNGNDGATAFCNMLSMWQVTSIMIYTYLLLVYSISSHRTYSSY